MPASASQNDSPLSTWALDREIVKRNFVNVAGVKSDATALEVFTIVDAGQILPIGIKPQVTAFDSDFQLIGSTAGFDGVRLRPVDKRRLCTGLMLDDLILGFVARVNQQRIILELSFFLFAVDHQAES